MNNNTYTPKPIDTSAVILSDDLLALTEALAKNVHENWSAARIAEGWSYGEERNDKLKTNPCLVEYEKLPASEQEYDRATAMETIRMILTMGYAIVRDDRP